MSHAWGLCLLLTVGCAPKTASKTAPPTVPPAAPLTSAPEDAAVACTKMDCSDELTITMPAPRAVRGKAAVVYELVLDGKKVTCRTRGCDSGAPVSLTGAEGGKEPVIAIAGAPASVRLRVRGKGAAAGEKTYAPVYKDVRPNGPGCDPVCRQAAVRWE